MGNLQPAHNGPSRPGKSAARHRAERRDNLTAWIFLSPWVIGFICFSGIPILASFALSLMKWDMIDNPVFIGLANYKQMFAGDSQFWNCLLVTLEFTVGSVIVTTLGAFIMAVLLNLRLRGMGIFQFLFFAPAVMPSVALAYIFQMILNQHAGVLNYILTWFGVKNGPSWLYNAHYVIPTILFISLFTYSTGQMMLIFKSGLKEVPPELYEAGEVDGAGFFQKLWHITLPAISPVMLFNMVISAINSLGGSFALIFPLTGGGPGRSSQVLSVDIYINAFRNSRMGYASADAVVLFVLAALLSAALFAFSSKWVTYDN